MENPLDYMVLVISREAGCNLAFKGGWMLNQLMQNSRLTSDVDFSIEDKGVYEHIKNVLLRIAEGFKSDGIIADYRIRESISEHNSGGIDMYDSMGARILGVDVGCHNLGYGIREYNLNWATIDGFEIERMLADKLIAILSGKRYRRTKDLYDFYAMAGQFDFSARKLREYIDLRGGAEWDNIPFSDEVLREYEKAWSKLVLVSADNTGIIEKPDFMLAVSRFNVVALYVKNDNCTRQWNHIKMGWV